MGIIDQLRALLQPKAPVEASATELIYVLLPESLQPLDRGARYEDPLEAELQLSGIGWISGGGSQLGEERDDGTRPIEFCGIDVDVTDVTAGRELLRLHLPELGCPAGTRLYYCEGDERLEDEYDGSAWILAQPRDDLHPGFGI